MALHYHGEAQRFFIWWERGVFLEDFYFFIFCSYWENKSPLSIWLRSKNSKWIIARWSYNANRITFLPGNCAFGVGCIYSSVTIYCPLRLIIVMKDPFFFTCNDIVMKHVISLSLKKNCHYGYVIFVILLIKSMRKLNAQ